MVINFIRQLGQAIVLLVWSHTSLDVSVHVFFRFQSVDFE